MGFLGWYLHSAFSRLTPRVFLSNSASCTASGSGQVTAVPRRASRKVLGGFVLFSTTCGCLLLFKIATGWWNDHPKTIEPELPMYRTLLTPTVQDKSTSAANILYCTNTLKCAVLKTTGAQTFAAVKITLWKPARFWCLVSSAWFLFFCTFL